MSGSVPKSRMRRSNAESEDRISSLPDGILCYILSLLPTKYVVRSSALSTRWKYLWTYVPTLHFCDHPQHIERFNRKRDDKNFMNFVDRVLHLSNESYISKFSLKCVYTHDEERINTWISTILKRKVEEVILEIGLQHLYTLPSSLFTCESLRILRIDAESDVNLPSFISFPSLKYMHFTFIKFQCHQMQVSFTLPILEEFVLHNCEWVEIETVNIFAPELETWILDDYSYSGENDFLHGCKINLYAEKLLVLDMISNLSYELYLYNLSSLVTASIDVSSNEDISHRASELLQTIRNVQDLTLSDASIVTFSNEDIAGNLLTFSNLIRLSVTVDLNENIWHGSPSVGQLIHLLCQMPFLEVFHFTNGYDACQFDEDAGTLGSVPECNLSHLKSVKLELFYGSKNELFLVNFLLKNAIALEKMDIIPSLEDPQKGLEVAKQLLRLPRSSTIGLIDFSSIKR